jgi:predicted PurR-regulated permease PerM
MFTFNDRIKQILLLVLIILLVVASFNQLRAFMPGLLGAVTFYILSRGNYFQLVYNRKWKRGWAAGLYIIYYLFLLGVPIFLAIVLVSPKVNAALEDPTAILDNVKKAVTDMQIKMGINFISEKSLNESLSKLSAFVPKLINSTANLITNLITMLFFLYYMLYHGREMEKTLYRLIPLTDRNTSMLASETKRMVRANAIGIPLISIIQGIFATLGYFVFGVADWGIWGFLTGVFAFFPVIGTMIVWVPLVVYMYASGDTGNATALLFYSVIITGNVDYLARITIMKRIGNVHPTITVLGVIVGLGLFGFVGLIFGPLLVNYIIVLSKIYMNEFTHHELDGTKAPPEGASIVEKKVEKSEDVIVDPKQS